MIFGQNREKVVESGLLREIRGGGMNKIGKKRLFGVILVSALIVMTIVLSNIIYWRNRAIRDGYYFIDIDGNIVSRRFENVGEFEYGWALGSEKKGDKELFYYIDTNFKIIGEKITDQKHIFLNLPYDGEYIFSVLSEDSINLLDRNMKSILKVPYNTEGIEDIRDVVRGISKNGLFPIKSPSNNKWGYMDLNGDMVIEPKFDDAERFNDEGYAIVFDRDKQKYAVIDSEGNYKINPIYSNIELYGEGIALVSEKYEEPAYFIDFVGNKQSDKLFYGYSSNKHASDGYIPIQQYDKLGHGLFGYIDYNMNYLIEPIYSETYDFSKGMGRVENKEGLYGYVDSTGKEIIPCQYDWAYDYDEYGYASVSVNGKHGLIRQDGSYYVEPNYEYIGSFFEGYALVKLKRGQKVKINK